MMTPLVAVARPVVRSISTVSLPDRDLMFKSWRSGAAWARTTAAKRNAIARSGRGRVIRACFKIRRGPANFETGSQEGTAKQNGFGLPSGFAGGRGAHVFLSFGT